MDCRASLDSTMVISALRLVSHVRLAISPVSVVFKNVSAAAVSKQLPFPVTRCAGEDVTKQCWRIVS